MATTKTLTPTNQTITIQAFQGEKPDFQYISDAEGIFHLFSPLGESEGAALIRV